MFTFNTRKYFLLIIRIIKNLKNILQMSVVFALIELVKN